LQRFYYLGNVSLSGNMTRQVMMDEEGNEWRTNLL
jgi:hypothetical protein